MTSTSAVDENRVTLTAPTDLAAVEEHVRLLSRAERAAPCSALQSMSYRMFRLQCLRSLRLHQGMHLPAFSAYLGNNVSLSFEEGVVTVRYSMPRVPGSKTTSKRKREGKESGLLSSSNLYELVGSESD